MLVYQHVFEKRQGLLAKIIGEFFEFINLKRLNNLTEKIRKYKLLLRIGLPAQQVTEPSPYVSDEPVGVLVGTPPPEVP